MEKYIQMLSTYTCIVLKEDAVIFTSKAAGVKPLLDLYEERGQSEVPLTVIDRIIGKGAVILALKCGITKIITPIISQVAYEYALAAGITVEADKIVPMIINRQKDGRCPIETAVLEIEDPDKGYNAIKIKLKALQQSAKG